MPQIGSIGSLEILTTPISSVDVQALLAALTPTLNGEVIIGSTGHPPVAATLTGGTGISIVNGPGSITINSSAQSPTQNGQLIIGSTGNPPVAATITGGSGISIINGPGSIMISSSATGFSWNVITGSAAMSPSNGYIANNNVTPVTFTLPAAPAVGDTYQIVGFGSAGWTISLSGGQLVHMLGKTATTSISSTDQYDSLQIVCVDATGPQFVIATSEGNLTIV
jgi:hypothetical protein